MVRHGQVHARMPAGAVEDEDNLFLWVGVDLAGTLGQFDLKHGNADGRREEEDGPTQVGMDKSHQIAPGIALLDEREGPLAFGRLDPAQERLAANAMFIGSPPLDPGLSIRAAETRWRPSAGAAFTVFEGLLLCSVLCSVG
jgi:hypothetical protein